MRSEIVDPSVFVVGAVQLTIMLRFVTVALTPVGGFGDRLSEVRIEPNTVKWSVGALKVMWSTFESEEFGVTSVPLAF